MQRASKDRYSVEGRACASPASTNACCRSRSRKTRRHEDRMRRYCIAPRCYHMARARVVVGKGGGYSKLGKGGGIKRCAD